MLKKGFLLILGLFWGYGQVAWADTLHVMLTKTNAPISLRQRIVVGSDIPIPNLMQQNIQLKIVFKKRLPNVYLRFRASHPLPDSIKVIMGKWEKIDKYVFELRSDELLLTGFTTDDYNGFVLTPELFVKSSFMPKVPLSHQKTDIISIEQSCVDEKDWVIINQLYWPLQISLASSPTLTPSPTNSQRIRFRVKSSSANNPYKIITGSVNSCTTNYQVNQEGILRSQLNRTSAFFFSKNYRAEAISLSATSLININPQPVIKIPIIIYYSSNFGLEQKTRDPNNLRQIYEDTESLINTNLNHANVKLKNSYMGVSLKAEYINKHDFRVLWNGFCFQRTIDSLNGVYDSDALNVYFLSFRPNNIVGYGCNKCVENNIEIENLVFIDPDAFNDTFAHEVGHFLSLGHVGNSILTDNNIMNDSTRIQTASFNLGQALKANFHEKSGLHNGSVKINHSRETVLDCGHWCSPQGGITPTVRNP